MQNGLSARHNRKKEEARNTSNICVTQLPVRSQLENKAACFPAKVPYTWIHTLPLLYVGTYYLG